MMFFKHIKTLVALTFLFVGVCSFINLYGQDSVKTVIRVGVYQNPPKIYVDENKKAAGIFIDLLSEIAKNENWELQYVPAKWNDCIENLKNGKIDLLPDVAFTTERYEQFEFNTIPVLESWTQVYAGKNSGIYRLSDLDGKRIAVLERSVNQLKLVQLLKGYGYHYELVIATSFPDAFSMVKTGVADAAVANHFFGDENYKNYGLERTNIIFNPALLHYATFHGQNSWVLNTIDSYLSDWINTPGSFYYKVTEKHLNNQDKPKKSNRKSWYYVLAFLVLLGAALVILHWQITTVKFKKLQKSNQLLLGEEKKYRKYIENAPLGILVVDKNRMILETNQMASVITGYSEKQLLEMSIPDLISENALEDAAQHFQNVVENGKAEGIIILSTKSGEQRCCSVNAVKTGENRFIGFIVDITKELKEKESLDKFGKIFDFSMNEIYLFNPNTLKFVDVNPAVLKNTGYSKTEILNLTPLDLKLDLTSEEFKKIIASLQTGEKEKIVFETRHYRKDKTFYHAEIHLQLIEYLHEKLFSAIVLDITERKKAEEELQRLKTELEKEVDLKTRELKLRLAELEQFHEATIERELRMEELRKEIESLKNSISKKQ